MKQELYHTKRKITNANDQIEETLTPLVNAVRGRLEEGIEAQKEENEHLQE